MILVRNMVNLYKKHSKLMKWVLFFCVYIPIIGAGKNFAIPVHDELDGELLTYIYAIKRFGSEYIPELFNGTIKSSLTPPALLFVPLYLLPPEIGVFMQYMIVASVAFWGMYLCVDFLLGNEAIAVSIALMFCCLPFYAVYGFSVMGKPYLLYLFMLLANEKKENYVKSYIGIALYTIGSSLVLSGYSDLLILSFIFVYCSIVNKKIEKKFAWGLGEMLFLYFVTNIGLLKSIFGKTPNFVSHKTELFINPSPFGKTFINAYVKGFEHAESCQETFLGLVIIILFVLLVFHKKLNKTNLHRLMILHLIIIAITLFYAIYKWEPIVDFRNQLGGVFVEFQADRFYWMYPSCWFLVLAFSLDLFGQLCRSQKNKVVGVIIVLVFSAIYMQSTLYVNLRKDLGLKYDKEKVTSVNDFYQPGLFDEVRKFIGKNTEEYRVCSIGLFPSVALYNGFYCLDGYSNNYSLEYKHKFREAIIGEISKSEELINYFDNWGNRCYLFVKQIWWNGFHIPKDSGAKITELSLDFDVLHNLGAQYIFSTVLIENCEDIKLLNEFSKEESFYTIYLYEIKPQNDI